MGGVEDRGASPVDETPADHEPEWERGGEQDQCGEAGVAGCVREGLTRRFVADESPWSDLEEPKERRKRERGDSGRDARALERHCGRRRGALHERTTSFCQYLINRKSERS